MTTSKPSVANGRFSVGLLSIGFFSAGIISAGMLVSTPAVAAGFQISETSLSGLGRAFAGAGVAGDDASDLFYNPAGMFLQSGRQFQLGVSGLSISGQFENKGSTQTFTTAAGRLTVPTQGDDSDGGISAAVPNLFYVTPGNDRFKWGIGITAPFGLTTEYDSEWVGRYHGIKSELTTVELNPSFAWRLSDTVALGAGVYLMKGDTTLSRAVFTGPGRPDGSVVVQGDDTTYGFNVGAMFSPSDSTRIGIGIRSKAELNAKGTRTVTGTGRADGRVDASADVTLPETIYLSAVQEVSDQLSLMGSIRWTNWSRFDELRIRFGDGSPDSVTPEQWKDSKTVSIGGAYKMPSGWTLRAGIAYDETPVPSANLRTPRIPDDNRTWLTVGASFNASDNITIDVGYSHILGGEPSLANTVDLVSTAPGAFTDTLRGTYTDTDADIFGVQLQYRF